MNEENIIIRLDNVEKKVDLIEKEIEELKKNQQNSNKEGDHQGKKDISIKEFLIEKAPSKDFQKTLVICHYLEKYKDMNIFNAQDIDEGYREAKETVPANVNYQVIQNIKKGYIMEAKEKKDNLKAWSLTNTGEKIIEDGFKNE